MNKGPAHMYARHILISAVYYNCVYILLSGWAIDELIKTIVFHRNVQ